MTEMCPTCKREFEAEDCWHGTACEKCGGVDECEIDCECEKAREEYFKEHPWNQE